MEPHPVLLWLCLGGFLALMILAALEDIRTRRIPNWLNASVAALYPLYVLVTPASVTWFSAFGAAAAIFLRRMAAVRARHHGRGRRQADHGRDALGRPRASGPLRGRDQPDRRRPRDCQSD